MGMFLAFCLTASCLLLRLRGSAVALGWLAPSLILAALVLIGVVRGRVGIRELPGDPALIGHVVPSLGVAAMAWLRESVLEPNPAVWLVRAALFLATRWVMATAAPRDGAPLLGLALAFAGTTFVGLWAVYFQFGMPCCQRHDAMRACLLGLSCAALGAWSARRWPARPPGPLWQAIPLVLALLILRGNRAGDVIEAYATYASAIEADRLTWQSARTPGDTMVLHLAPNSHLVGNGATGAPGRYVQGDDDTSPLRGLLWLFGKRVISVLAPVR